MKFAKILAAAVVAIGLNGVAFAQEGGAPTEPPPADAAAPAETGGKEHKKHEKHEKHEKKEKKEKKGKKKKKK